MKLSEARQRACKRCGAPFVTRYANATQECCSRSCGRLLLAEEMARTRYEHAMASLPVGTEVVEIPLTQGMVALIDIGNLEAICRYEWQAVLRSGNWYARTARTLYMHHVVLPVADGLDVDHVNGNGLDNRRSNLRHATRSQNRANQHRVSGASGTKGVYWHSRDRVWQAAVAGKHLGYFTNKDAAKAAYDAAAKAAFGEFACQK